jgi:hypothetical protein
MWWYSLKRWFRHHKWNPIPCSCYTCEIRKPLSQEIVDILNAKLAAGDYPVRKLPKRDKNGLSD